MHCWHYFNGMELIFRCTRILRIFNKEASPLKARPKDVGLKIARLRYQSVGVLLSCVVLC